MKRDETKASNHDTGVTRTTQLASTLAEATEGTSQRRSRDALLDRLVKTAGELFFRQGYSATTMDDIARGFGVLKGSLYHHIRSKDELLYMVIKEAVEDYEGHLQACAALSGSAAEKVRFFVEQHVLNTIRHRISVGVFHREFRHLSGTYREEVVFIRDQYDRFLRGLIAEGQEDGSIRKGADPFLTSSAVMGMINTVPTWFDPDRPLSADEVAKAYGEIAAAIVAP